MTAAGRLTVHVLDTARGRPGAGIALALYRLAGAARERIGVFRTNADGRCDTPLLAGAELVPGLYEIEFDIGAWRRAASEDPAHGFYDVVPIRFRIDDVSANYHVPLILAPFGYSTYRGS